MRKEAIETKTWLLAGAGIALVGWIWNKYKTDSSVVLSSPKPTLTSQVGSLITKAITSGNTGIAGGSTTTAQQTASTAPVTQAQFVDVLGQINTIITDITTPASTVKVAGADAQTKFNEALKWARSAIITTTNKAGTTKANASNVKLTVGGNIYTLDLNGNQIGAAIPDTTANRAPMIASGYSIF